MTGIRMAQTRGGKKFWRGWSASTKGCKGEVGQFVAHERQGGAKDRTGETVLRIAGM